MNTAPALEWLDASFDSPPPRRPSTTPSATAVPMFTLKSAMDAGPSMHVLPGDYDDPLRWWL